MENEINVYGVIPAEFTYENETVQMSIKRFLTFAERTSMVRLITSFVFDDNGDTIEAYHPEYARFAKLYSTVKYYTDYQLPETIEEKWEVLTKSDICQKVFDIVGEDIQEIFNEADSAVAARCRHMENRLDINGFLKKITDKINSVIDSLGVSAGDIDVSSLIDIFKNMKGASGEEIVKGILNYQNAKEAEKKETKDE